MRVRPPTLPIAVFLGILGIAAIDGQAAFTPVLSEIMASNATTLADEDGEFSDWIEIQNTGDTAGDLAGWFLSDDADNLSQWAFPTTPLAPGAIVVVFASDKNRATTGSELHTNFKLRSGGEFLGLTMPDGTTTPSAFDPAFPQQFADTSWGQPGYFDSPTPGATNSAAGSAPVRAVDFTPGNRLFTTNVQVALSTPTSGTTIYYTTDGSEPTSANGVAYTGPITLTSTTELRARAQFSDADAGPTGERKYLKMAADMLSFTSPLPILVLDNFGAGSVPQRNPSSGPNGNDGSGVIQVARQEVLAAFFDPAPLSGQASPADAPSIITNAGIRVRGSSSASLSKKPFSFEAWEDGANEQSSDIAPFGMPAESDWVLYAPTEAFSGNRYDRPLLHNSFIYKLSNEIGRYAARTQFVELFLNTGGGDLSMSDYAGLYIFMEQRKRGKDRIDFAKLSQDGSDGGWMINVDRMDPVPIGGIGTPRHFHTPGPNQILETPNDSPFGVRGRDDRPEYYHSFFNFESPGGYEISTEQRKVIESEMNAFEDALYGPDWKDPAIGYAAHIDVDNFIDQYILQNLTKNQDAYVLSTLIYRDRLPDKLKFGPVWDFDRGYTTSPTNTNPTSNLRFADDRMWFPRLFADPDFEQKYIDRWQQLRNGKFATGHMHAIIDAQKAEITEAVAVRNGTSNWPAKVTAMKNWLADRTEAIDAQFTPPVVFNLPGGAVPTGFEVTMNGLPGSTIYYTTDGSDPRLPGGGISANAIAYDSVISDEDLFPFETPCRYHVPTDDSLGLSWADSPDSFDDSSWTQATPGLGWENLSSGTLVPRISTDISSDLRFANPGGYFRWQFDVTSAADVNTLSLQVTIDDGFVAYLNGEKIGSFNAPDPVAWNSTASGSRPDSTVLSTPITIDASPVRSHLRDGSNALAIHAMGTSLGGTDFLIDAWLQANLSIPITPLVLSASQTIIARRLDGSDWSGPAQATFAVGSSPASAANLVVSEIMYNPSPPTAEDIDAGFLDGDQFEFIELLNISSGEIDLSGVAFTDGIEFTFAAGLGSLLPAAGRVVIVKNLAAFEHRYGQVPGIRIAGEFASDTNLRDSGEQIGLTSIGGSPIRSFSYDDTAPWPESADGDGFSLTLDLPLTNPDHSVAGNWHSSAAAGGAPGGSGTVAFTGEPQIDVDGDGLSRLLEFSTGTDDSAPSNPPLDLESAADGSLTISYTRNLAARGIRYTVETSTDLVSWTGDSVRLDETNLGDGRALIRHRAAPGTDRRRYVRLHVELE